MGNTLNVWSEFNGQLYCYSVNFLESDFAACLSLAVPAGASSHQQSERWCEEVNVMNSVGI